MFRMSSQPAADYRRTTAANINNKNDPILSPYVPSIYYVVSTIHLQAFTIIALRRKKMTYIPHVSKNKNISQYLLTSDTLVVDTYIEQSSIAILPLAYR